MLTTTNKHRQLNFDQAVGVAIDLLPGLRFDLQVIADRRNTIPKDLEGTGRIALEIPDPIIPLLRQYHPELFQDDSQLEGKAWLKFMIHPDSERFRVQGKI